jgi:hypothetical protein
MNRLNYFNPYDSKAGSHEDQLTRAYLVLLKHSCHAFFTFFEFARSKHKTAGKEESFTIVDFLEQGWDIETQKGNPVINTNYLLSILITDSHISLRFVPVLQLPGGVLLEVADEKQAVLAASLVRALTKPC